MLSTVTLKKAARLAHAVASDAEYDERSVRRVLQQLDEEFEQALTDSELATAARPERLASFGRI
ncbi:MAG TPA: hypothetical protein VKB58_02555 [Terriglobales bacterium]|jgi:hypothetical protein|nr:hypothetical protein [Terriglobales bacterium]